MRCCARGLALTRRNCLLSPPVRRVVTVWSGILPISQLSLRHSLHTATITAFDPYSPSSLSASHPSAASPNTDNTTSSSSSSHRNDSIDALKQRILDLALSSVPSLGWTEDALRSAISALHLSPSLLSPFPDPLLALLTHFHHTATIASLSALHTLQSSLSPPLNTTQLLTRAVLLQLEQHSPYAPHLPSYVGLSLSPHYVVASSSLVADWADRVWYELGDVSTDLHWYGKRGVLVAVYVSTLLHASCDGSLAWRDTAAFVERRMQEAETMQAKPDELARAVEQYGGIVYNAVTSVLSQQRNK
jgi:ubiquinone biosynthesis protein COQ9